MLRKLFGETDEEQFAYLKPRITALGVAAVLVLIGALLTVIGIGLGQTIMGIGQFIWVILLFNFGWAIFKGLFGIASFGVCFSNNVAFGCAIIMLYFMVGAVGGVIVSIIGLCRFLVLLKKRK